MTRFEPIERFAEPFDPSEGALSDAEKLEAAADFSHLIDDVYLAHIADIKPDSDNLTINIQDADPDGRYVSHLEVTIYTSKEFGDEKKIQITEHHKVYRPKLRATVYTLKSNGDEVTRLDEECDVKQVTQVAFRTPQYSAESMMDEVRSMVSEFDNSELEKDLGYNDQPIGPDEVVKLRRLLLR